MSQGGRGTDCPSQSTLIDFSSFITDNYVGITVVILHFSDEKTGSEWLSELPEVSQLFNKLSSPAELSTQDYKHFWPHRGLF